MSYRRMSLEGSLKEKIYSEKKDRMKCDVTIRTCVTTIHRDQRYLHLVADRSYRNTSTTLTTTPFQNIQHFCQCKISNGMILNLLFFEVLIYYWRS